VVGNNGTNLIANTPFFKKCIQSNLS